MNPDMLYLQQNARLLGVELDEKQLALFDLYQNELLKWNEKTNLISEKTTGDIVKRHFLDSLTAARFITLPHSRIVDVGSGAGFPGIPLKISLPSIQLYLLESNRKKVSFLKQVIRLLKLENTFIIHDRTENVTRTDAWREKFEMVISRAAFKLSDLLPLGRYFLVPEGLLITLKGQDVSSELKTALKDENTSKIYQINQYDINKSLLGPPRKIIIARKTK
jgi:16S rRNA (guanine527-N7)-methyltransferase